MSVTSRIRPTRRIVIVALVLFGALYTAEARAAVPGSYAALAQAHLARAGGPAAGKLLGGFTKQGAPVVIGVARNQKRVSVVAILQMSCTSGNVFLTEDYWPKLSVAGNGSARSAVPIAPSGGASSAARVTGGSHSIAGSLNRKRGRFVAVMRLQLNFAFQNGQTDSCDSGNVPIAAVL